MDCLSDSQLNSTLTTINDTVQYLSQTIDDFRDFFNPKNNIEKEFYVDETINKTFKLGSTRFIANNIEIIKEIKNFKLFSVENEIIQVIMNVLNLMQLIISVGKILGREVKRNGKKKMIVIFSTRGKLFLYI